MEKLSKDFTSGACDFTKGVYIPRSAVLLFPEDESVRFFFKLEKRKKEFKGTIDLLGLLLSSSACLSDTLWYPQQNRQHIHRNLSQASLYYTHSAAGTAPPTYGCACTQRTQLQQHSVLCGYVVATELCVTQMFIGTVR